MGETTSQASLVISRSSVRGLSFTACMAVLENLDGTLIGAKASALMAKAKQRER
jgi:hypothetical protein